MKILSYTLILLLFFTTFTLQSQEFGSNTINSPSSEDKVIVQANKGFNPDVSVTLGSSFMSFGQGYNAFGTYVMPEMTLPITKKFAVRAGLGYSTMFYSSPYGQDGMFSDNMSQYGQIYVSGLYQVNEKLTLSGTVYKTFDLTPKQNEANPRALDYSNEGVNFNVDYKVNDHLRINAGFSYQKSNSFNYYDPFYMGGSNFGASPFSDPMFGPGF